eukprot:scaffold122804_cov37-Tisochrysis_lutea.AAC.1
MHGLRDVLSMSAYSSLLCAAYRGKYAPTKRHSSLLRNDTIFVGRPGIPCVRMLYIYSNYN